MTKRAAMVLAVVVAATLALSGVALAKTFKFTFEDVTLTDGDFVVENGVIEAATKETKKSVFTNCNYYTEDYQEYLGQFQSEEFFSDDNGEVEDFCVNNFENRVE